MPGGFFLLGCLGSLLLASLLAGLLARRRYRACSSFVLYVLAVWLADGLILAWPGRFYRWDFWLLKEAVHSVLTFAVALELTAHTFRAFPSAHASARWVSLLVVAVSCTVILALPGDRFDLAVLAGELYPRVLAATMWLFVAIGALIVWYRLPVDPFQK